MSPPPLVTHSFIRPFDLSTSREIVSKMTYFYVEWDLVSISSSTSRVNNYATVCSLIPSRNNPAKRSNESPYLPAIGSNVER